MIIYTYYLECFLFINSLMYMNDMKQLTQAIDSNLK